MVKIIDAAGIPAVHICTIAPISESVGVNRIVPGVSIPHPLGDPNVSLEEEKEIRREKLMLAFKALSTEIDKQTTFDGL